ncbi:host attachment protein [Ferrovibrio terrae]|uniref:host attachment protein n=1 Tax=Ferrovibrio terrae TaxID=2594003 RepID=UPI0031382EBA
MAIPLPSPTWILVADASQARIFELRSLADPLAAVPDFTMTAEDTHGFSRDLKSDRPGRAFASSDNRRAAVEPRHDPHQLAKDRFAEAIAERLNHACGEKRFVQLVVIAPPRLLGALRQDFNAAVRATVAVEINKDLVKADRADILDHVKAALSPSR